jgi:mycothiol S-conjugate amidase
MSELCLLTVHAHPDDEASKGAGSVARYHAEGVHTVLVTCTGGEAGDILNPAMDRPEVRDNLPQIRRAELHESARIIGYDEVVFLGYRDSGMPGTEANADSRSFAQAPLEEAVSRLVEVIRRTRPQVIVTYPQDQSGYPHPDHLRAHEVSVAAWDAAGDAERFAGRGDPWTPSKLYSVTWSPWRVLRMHEAFLSLGMESPYSEDRLVKAKEMAEAEGSPTTRVDITGFAEVSLEALKAHATQVDPTSRHWFGLPPEVAEAAWPYDEYQLLAERSAPQGPGEDDLFAGVRQPANR